ncbi:MAG: LPS export ABC transporter periplasmic protein LptC [Spirochaetae bacterium HGW-Spirochaetae-8]|nr:MAG: LPS export ABC transporter periplasmic protein LptC [Spirochaetae bacterium HGW-Spirochaetae-8]
MHQRKNTGFIIFLLLVLLMSTAACSFVPPEGSAIGKPADNPDLLMQDAEYLLGIAGNEPVLIRAKTIEIYQTAGKAYLENITFTQQDSQGQTTVSGKALAAQIDTKTNNVSLTGDIVIINHLDDLEITAQALTWIHDRRIFESEAESEAQIAYGNGNSVRGTGFSADFTQATYEFLKISEGVLHYE